jgi:ABC-type protease/lipase transport system fused ATPase/permease subunit
MNLLQPFSSTTKFAPRSELSAALASCRSAFIATALFSGMSNILMLTGAIFMLEIYDRVLPSRSVPTLVALIILATSLYAALGILDLSGRILVRVGASLDEAISDRVYDALVCLPLKAGNGGDGLQSLRNLDSLRSFLSGMGPIALFDMPWIPLYLIICFAFHTLIGLTALFGAIVLCALTILTEVYTRDSTNQVIGLGVSRNNLADTSRGAMPRRSLQWE